MEKGRSCEGENLRGRENLPICQFDNVTMILEDRTNLRQCICMLGFTLKGLYINNPG